MSNHSSARSALVPCISCSFEASIECHDCGNWTCVFCAVHGVHHQEFHRDDCMYCYGRGVVDFPELKICRSCDSRVSAKAEKEMIEQHNRRILGEAS